MTSPDLVLGLDSGGTKTLAALADRQGAVRWRRLGPSLDPFAEPEWRRRLVEMLHVAQASAPGLNAAALGLSCYGEVPDVSRQQADAVAECLSCPHLVLNDVRVAFDGALAGRAGVLLLAGTGSMAWAGDRYGTDLRIGGWGHPFGDEGSAHWIGREALSTATRALDGRGHDGAFARALLAALDLSAEDLLGVYLTPANRRSAIASVARVVDRLAEAGDSTAIALLGRAAAFIAEHAGAARRRLGLPSDSTWSFAGGVFASRTIMAGVTHRLGHPPEPPRLAPVGGALLRAARHAGWPADDDWIAHLSRALSVDVQPETDTAQGERP